MRRHESPWQRLINIWFPLSHWIFSFQASLCEAMIVAYISGTDKGFFSLIWGSNMLHRVQPSDLKRKFFTRVSIVQRYEPGKYCAALHHFLSFSCLPGRLSPSPPPFASSLSLVFLLSLPPLSPVTFSLCLSRGCLK